MKDIYYYEGVYSLHREDVEQFIAENEYYNSEEDLLRIQENEVGVVDCKEDLKQYCLEYGLEYDEVVKLW